MYKPISYPISIMTIMSLFTWQGWTYMTYTVYCTVIFVTDKLAHIHIELATLRWMVEILLCSSKLSVNFNNNWSTRIFSYDHERKHLRQLRPKQQGASSNPSQPVHFFLINLSLVPLIKSLWRLCCRNWSWQ